MHDGRESEAGEQAEHEFDRPEASAQDRADEPQRERDAEEGPPVPRGIRDRRSRAANREEGHVFDDNDGCVTGRDRGLTRFVRQITLPGERPGGGVHATGGL